MLRAVFLVVLLQQTGAVPRIPAAWVGSWEFVPQESVYPGPAPQRPLTYNIEPWNDGFKMTYYVMDPQGRVARLRWVGKLDGRDYPVQIIGATVPQALTNAFRSLDDGSIEIIVRANGNFNGRTKAVISRDGTKLTMTTHVTGSKGQPLTSTTVYRKRE